MFFKNGSFSDCVDVQSGQMSSLLPILGTARFLTACVQLLLPLPVAAQRPLKPAFISISFNLSPPRTQKGARLLTWCDLYVQSPLRFWLPTSAPAQKRHSETHKETNKLNKSGLFRFKCSVPQSQGPSPSRRPLQPPSHSRCGPPLTSTSGGGLNTRTGSIYD